MLALWLAIFAESNQPDSIRADPLPSNTYIEKRDEKRAIIPGFADGILEISASLGVRLVDRGWMDWLRDIILTWFYRLAVET